jgi:hypothetical protein
MLLSRPGKQGIAGSEWKRSAATLEVATTGDDDIEFIAVVGRLRVGPSRCVIAKLNVSILQCEVREAVSSQRPSRSILGSEEGLFRHDDFF